MTDDFRAAAACRAWVPKRRGIEKPGDRSARRACVPGWRRDGSGKANVRVSRGKSGRLAHRAPCIGIYVTSGQILTRSARCPIKWRGNGVPTIPPPTCDWDHMHPYLSQPACREGSTSGRLRGPTPRPPFPRREGGALARATGAGGGRAPAFHSRDHAHYSPAPSAAAAPPLLSLVRGGAGGAVAPGRGAPYAILADVCGRRAAAARQDAKGRHGSGHNAARAR
jgi:hypothetical protein